MPFPRFSRRGLKAQVALISLLVFLASLWSLGWYLGQVMRSDLREVLSSQQQTTVTYIVDDIEQEFRDRRVALERTASAMPSSLLFKPEALQNFIGERHVLLGMFNGGIIVYREKNIAGMSRISNLLGNYVDVETLVSVLNDGVTRIGQPIQDKGTRQAAFGMVTPIRDERGRIVGALSGVTLLHEPNFLHDITQNRHGKTGGYLLIAPKRRVIVSATDAGRTLELLPEPGQNPVIDRLLDGDEETAIISDRDGRDMLISDKTVPSAGWILAAILPTSEAFRPINSLQRQMFYSGLPIALIAGISIWLILHYLLTPLFDAVRELSTMSVSKNLSHTLSVRRPDEIGELVAAFNRLLTTLNAREASLRQVKSSLELTVVERTRQLRALTTQLTRTEENERRQLAQELHDELGQLLAVIRIKLAQTGALPEDVATLIADAERMVRSITRQLSPPVLQSGKLKATLEWLADDIEQRFGVTINLDLEADIDQLPPELLAVLYRSIRELLINIAKHSDAKDANILVRHISTELVVTVRDEGCGFAFDPFAESISSRQGWGLRSIRERIADLGGFMEIDSRPNEGTSITLGLPLSVEQSEVQS